MSVTYDDKARYYEYLINNNHLLDSYTALQQIYQYLITDPTYLKFGTHKVIMIHAIDHDTEYSFHHNIGVKNSTTFEEYYSKVEDVISEHYDEGYSVDVVPIFKVRFWNMDSMLNKHIRITRDARTVHSGFQQIRGLHTSTIGLTRSVPCIKPLPSKDSPGRGKTFYTMDIETIQHKGFQLPILISFAGKRKNKLFLIPNTHNLENRVRELFDNFFIYLNEVLPKSKTVIFVHNLGGFDGIFLYKYLSLKYTKELNTIIDDSNKFILISLKLKEREIIFKDSLRIFPVSLQELCNIFNVSGKFCEYNPEFNKPSILNSPLLEELLVYAQQDSRALLNALLQAQVTYLKLYSVDITSVVSLPSLAFKIFRSKYLDKNIPILSTPIDNFIRNSYYGGAVDIYKAKAENLHYYDVNSLYPYAMTKDMPLNLIRSYNAISALKINLSNFFGFLEVTIECPLSVLRPVLPFKMDNRTLFPTGVFTATYFSEELKAVLPLGYKILKIHSAQEFDKGDLFTKYIQDMYHIKMNSTGSQRWISKLLQNSLYGLFGRKKELIETRTIFKHELDLYTTAHIIKSVIEVSDDKLNILMIKNVNLDIISALNITLNTSIQGFEKVIKANVALASAITSYARIHMIPFKIDSETVYTDTDSIFTTKPLPANLIGKGLGLMKDELNGLVIKQAYFLGIKEYGYWYLDSNNNRVEKSVWAGITRDSLSFQEIENLFKGIKIVKLIPNRFYKSLINLNISIKSINTSIMFNCHKKLVNNNYLPNHIFNAKYKHNLFSKLMFYIKKYIELFKTITNQ